MTADSTAASRPASGAARESLVIRPATIADLDEIWAIETATFGGEAWIRDSMAEELTAQHRHYVALVVPGDPASHRASAGRAAAEGASASDASVDGAAGAVRGYAGLLAIGADGDIQTIAVDEHARGGGYGRRLMNELLDEADRRGVREVFLEVRADNPVARGLYASLGFDEIGVRPRYYQPDDVDAVVMKLEMRRRVIAPSGDSAAQEYEGERA